MNIKLQSNKKLYYLKKRSKEEPGAGFEKTSDPGTKDDPLTAVPENDTGVPEQYETRQLAPVQIRRPPYERERSYENNNNGTCPTGSHNGESNPTLGDRELKGMELAIVQAEHDEELDPRLNVEGTRGGFSNDDNTGRIPDSAADVGENPVLLAGSREQKDDEAQDSKWLKFYGVVRDNNNKVVEGAVVMLSACFAGGNEKVLEHTFTDSEGAYFVSIPMPPGDIGITGFKVRAGKAGIIPENKNQPEHNREGRPGSFYTRDLYSFFKMLYPGV